MRRTSIAAVVIGRNEGARLRRCLASIKDQVSQIVPAALKQVVAGP